MDPSQVKQPPPKLIYKDGKLVRANLLWEPSSWFSKEGSGIVVPIPEEIFQTAMKRNDLDTVLKELEEVRKKQPTSCYQFTTSMLIFPCVIIPGVCCIQRMRSKNRVLKYDRDLREWQEQMNARYLRSIGCYVKTQSCARQVGSGERSNREIDHWIAIAFTAEESQRLANEPHVFGHIVDLTCCVGVKEEDMCMHPL
ncbi:hypothetical protein GUITHDRAFT_105826 [Guillardia theta CCMP2712]|uniref:Uncharacterized protein n=1 Tax=Guillardia theta (strain CCMP2712) TaxID=905079 RepID=L1JJ90_GUITC|nr:hypothetical protein GUITHDRAFT_105826 [Guillardia theta CCMP2712]EKX48219.1 hypothetical protein GUITHDRAFT_105826 [Guillardia theta CCMP2712]|eukprot:XP_005835199.1 hypothetical protein GUITHDRAFT_105826 [Guillardia theta CCMP2712]